MSRRRRTGWRGNGFAWTKADESQLRRLYLRGESLDQNIELMVISPSGRCWLEKVLSAAADGTAEPYEPCQALQEEFEREQASRMDA